MTQRQTATLIFQDYQALTIDNFPSGTPPECVMRYKWVGAWLRKNYEIVGISAVLCTSAWVIVFWRLIKIEKYFSGYFLNHLKEMLFAF